MRLRRTRLCSSAMIWTARLPTPVELGLYSQLYWSPYLRFSAPAIWSAGIASTQEFGSAGRHDLIRLDLKPPIGNDFRISGETQNMSTKAVAQRDAFQNALTPMNTQSSARLNPASLEGDAGLPKTCPNMGRKSPLPIYGRQFCHTI